MRRIGRPSNNSDSNRNRNINPNGYPDDDPSIQGVGSLLGADVKSLLDGESVVLPSDDDMSSINTNFNYSTAGNDVDNEQMRVVGHEQDDDSTTNGPWMMGGATPHLHVDTKAANNGNNNDNAPSENGSRRTCLPLWLANSPKWLKTAIIVATALLIGAIVLVAVAAVLNSGNGGATSRSAVAPTMPSAEPTLKPESVSSPAPTTLPVFEPSPSPLPSPLPSPSPSEFPSPEPSTKKEFTPTTTDSVAPASPVAVAPVLETSPPSQASLTKTVFYVTGGRPQDSELTAFESNLQKLPLDASFMVNLGDWNSPFATGCSEASFQDVDAQFQSSTVPVYFIPGDNEVCPFISSLSLVFVGYVSLCLPSSTTAVQ